MDFFPKETFEDSSGKAQESMQEEKQKDDSTC